MKMLAILLLAASSLTAMAQGAESHWYVDVHRFTPSLAGDIQGTSGGNAFDVDLRNDLGLVKGSTKPGFGLEYQGTRFGLELSRDEQDYVGSSQLQRSISVNGQTYAANTLVTSSFKATNNNFNWTIRALKWPGFWLGLDLGARATQIQLYTSGFADAETTTVSYKTTLPVPQLGPSLGFEAFGGRLVGRASYHLLAYKGSTYSHPAVDLRFFPISWLGVMAFADGEHFRVPQGSIKSDLDLTLDRSGTGFGLVARF
jgi:hypothetical protein